MYSYPIRSQQLRNGTEVPMSNKLFVTCTREELSSVFRTLADALEGTPSTDGTIPSLEAFRKLKIGIKDEYGQVSLKLKFRTDLGDIDAPECACGGAQKDGKPSYKSLKKRMRSSFKAVYQAVHAGQLPPDTAVEAFIGESRLMVQYPGFGDEYYAAYDKAVDDFVLAWERRDLAALHGCVDALNHLKTDCHQRYK